MRLPTPPRRLVTRPGLIVRPSAPGRLAPWTACRGRGGAAPPAPAGRRASPHGPRRRPAGRRPAPRAAARRRQPRGQPGASRASRRRRPRVRSSGRRVRADGLRGVQGRDGALRRRRPSATGDWDPGDPASIYRSIADAFADVAARPGRRAAGQGDRLPQGRRRRAARRRRSAAGGWRCYDLTERAQQVARRARRSEQGGELRRAAGRAASPASRGRRAARRCRCRRAPPASAGSSPTSSRTRSSRA